MPCFHPLTAWRTPGGNVVLSKEPKDGSPLRLPCGGCLGCRKEFAKSWTLRALLELQQHHSATFTTLTYEEAKKPKTLQKQHLQLFLKRLRKRLHPNRHVRFFACGEYGEQTNRPHYHAILYGTTQTDAGTIQDTWALGNTQVYTATPATIAYTAGYVGKKIGWKHQAAEEQIDYETGELYKWQPPFLQMSRRPGIGAHARQHIASWRKFAVTDGQKHRVPRYLHEAWKQAATPEQIEQLAYETYQHTKNIDKSPKRLKAAEIHEIKKQQLQANRRTKL